MQRKIRIEALMKAFGLQNQADTIIGTPIRKGVSGGQKRRVSVASQLITSPKILFLDEPTSGLDSASSYEVMRFVRNVARKYKVSSWTSLEVYRLTDRMNRSWLLLRFTNLPRRRSSSSTSLCSCRVERLRTTGQLRK